MFFFISSRLKIIASNFERNFFKSNIIFNVTIKKLTIDENCEIIWSIRFFWVRILTKVKKIILCIECFDVSKSYSLRIMSFIVKYSDWINSFILFIWFWRRILFNLFDNYLARSSWCRSKLKLRFEVMIVFANNKENSFEMISENNVVDFWMIDFWVFLMRLCFLFSCIHFSFLSRFFLNSCFFFDDLIMIVSYAIKILMRRKSKDEFFVKRENCKKDKMLKWKKKSEKKKKKRNRKTFL
jgi:hypothetical protein